MWHRTSLEEGIAGTTALTELCLEYLWNSVCLEQNEGENSVVAIPLSPSCPCPNPWDLQICYGTWQGGIKVVDGIKVTTQLTLRWRVYTGLSRWAQYNHKGRGIRKTRSEHHDVRRTQWNLAWFEHWRRGPWARECGTPLVARRNGLSSSPSRKNAALLIPWFWPSETYTRLLTSRILIVLTVSYITNLLF